MTITFIEDSGCFKHNTVAIQVIYLRQYEQKYWVSGPFEVLIQGRGGAFFACLFL